MTSDFQPSYQNPLSGVSKLFSEGSECKQPLWATRSLSQLLGLRPWCEHSHTQYVNKLTCRIPTKLNSKNWYLGRCGLWAVVRRPLHLIQKDLEFLNRPASCPELAIRELRDSAGLPSWTGSSDPDMSGLGTLIFGMFYFI